MEKAKKEFEVKSTSTLEYAGKKEDIEAARVKMEATQKTHASAIEKEKSKIEETDYSEATKTLKTEADTRKQAWEKVKNAGAERQRSYAGRLDEGLPGTRWLGRFQPNQGYKEAARKVREQAKGKSPNEKAADILKEMKEAEDKERGAAEERRGRIKRGKEGGKNNLNSMDYKETIKERLDILSPELRAFVLDENWRREAEKIGKQFNLNEEKYASFENEVFLVLLCFEPKTDFAENIKRELEIDNNMAGWIAEDVNKNIFSKVTIEIDLMWQATGQEREVEIEEEPKETAQQNNVGLAPHSESGVGGSFEQIILNQTKAMMPARPASEVPNNLPTSEQKTEETPKVIHNYTKEDDPYREPIE